MGDSVRQKVMLIKHLSSPEDDPFPLGHLLIGMGTITKHTIEQLCKHRRLRPAGNQCQKPGCARGLRF